MAPKTRRPRQLFRVLLLTPLPLLCLCCVISFALLNYDKLGRINDFLPVRNGLQIPGTLYSISYQLSSFDQKTTEIDLLNTQTQVKTSVGYINNPYLPPPTYSLLQHGDKLYFLLESQTDGSAGFLEFDILDITTDPPRSLLPKSDLMAGLSCTYPRLQGDTLEFETDDHCDFIGLTHPVTYSFTVPLN